MLFMQSLAESKLFRTDIVKNKQYVRRHFKTIQGVLNKRDIIENILRYDIVGEASAVREIHIS